MNTSSYGKSEAALAGGSAGNARLALLLEYDGRGFHGSQFQPGMRTVQSELEAALAVALKVPTTVTFSGRTDSGVHAYGQVAHIDIADRDLDLWRFCWSMNGILPLDLSVRAAQIVPADFHARYRASARRYVYHILNRNQRSPLMHQSHYFVPQPLNEKSFKEAATALLGRHDFAAFRSTNSDSAPTTICHVLRADLLNKGEGKLEFWIEADRFVYNMVRIIVGTLIEVGLGKKTPQCMYRALAAGDRNLAGPTAPPWGLILHSVEYPAPYQLFGNAVSQMEGSIEQTTERLKLIAKCSEQEQR